MERTKRLVSLILASSLLFTGCAAGKNGNNDTNNNVAGTFVGTGKGNNGSMKVEVTFADGKITEVTVKEHGETTGICEPAIERIPEQVVKNQTVLVDTVSGATNTSNGIVEAVKDCISQAGLDLNSFEVEVEKEAASGETIEVNTDVLVIGGGGAGVQAALRAQNEGAKVVLIEKNPALGGATVMNGSNIVATGSELAEEIFGYNGDTADKFYEDVNKGSKYTIKEELTRAMADTIGNAIDWVSEAAGLEYRKAQTQVADHSVERQVELDSSSSADLIEIASGVFEKKWWYNHA